MIQSVFEFDLTRSVIIVLGLVVSCAAEMPAFAKLDIKACPKPALAIFEITAQAAGQPAVEMAKYCTIPMEVLSRERHSEAGPEDGLTAEHGSEG